MAIIDGTFLNDTLNGSTAADLIRGFEGSDTITGGGGADTIDGGTGDDLINAGAGNEIIDGGSNNFDYDTLSYAAAAAAVFVNLSTGIATGGSGTDSVTNIERLIGSDFNDSLTGSASDNDFEGGLGNDTIDGGAGFDAALYFNAAGPISADMTTGAVTGGAGNDTLISIEAVGGGAFNDTIIGSSGDDIMGGMGGNDSLVGGLGFDRLYYGDAAGGVTVNLLTNAVSGADGVDTISGFEAVTGSEFNDSLTGSDGDDDLEGLGGADTLRGGNGNDTLWGDSGNDSMDGGAGNDSMLGGDGRDTLFGGAGNDTIDGGYIFDRINYDDLNFLSYQSATNAVTINLSGITGDGSVGFGTASDGLGGTDTLANVNFIIGGSGSDSITGSSAMIFEQFEGRGGNDTIDGGEIDTVSQNNGNRVSYANAAGAVTVDLLAGSATGADGTDTLININHVRGGASGDTLLGSNTTVLTEFFEGQGGNDTIDGRGGFDILRYDSSLTAVNVNLVSGTATGDGTDTFTNIEGVRGSNLGDVLTGGNTANNALEVFRGNGGNDTIDGGGGIDRVEYGSSRAGVTVLLFNGEAMDGLGGFDTLIGIENVRGSEFNDIIDADDGANLLEGRAGNDSLYGVGGNDTLIGGDGNDFLTGEEGADSLNGGNGDDYIEVARNDTGVNDTVDGGLGYDVVSYNYGDRTTTINFAFSGTTTQADGFGGTDTLSNIEEKHLFGGTVADTLTGDGTRNFIQGNGGNDTLTGSGGNDTFGYDLTGIFTAGIDRISDLQTGEDIRIQASGFSLFGPILSGNNATSLAAGQVMVGTPSGGVTTLYIGVDGISGSDLTVELVGNFTAADFQIFNDGSGTSLRYSPGAGGPVPTPGPDVLVGTAVADFIDGLAGDDNIQGLAGNDTLLGGEGNDNLTGGEGNDSLDGGIGADWANYYDATSAVAANLTTFIALGGGIGTDTLTSIENLGGSSFNDILTGDGFNNSLRGEVGNDTLVGNGGNDFITGGAGDDSIDGGAGTGDTADYFFSNATGAVNVNLQAGTATGGDGNDTLTGIENVWGTNFGDSLTGDANNNSFTANGGNDTVDGGAGNDNLNGGDGNDSLIGGAGSDFFVGGAGNDTMDGGVITDRANYVDLNSISYTSAVSGVNINLSGITGDGSTGSGTATDGLGGVDTLRNINFITASNNNDTITGSSALIFEQFEGGLGDDTIDGGAIDTVTGLNSNRATYANATGSVNVNLTLGTATGAQGNDTLININHVRGGNSADTLTGSNATLFTEQFEGRAGNDTIDGLGGTDMVRYDSATVGVNVNLVTGIAQDGQGGTDTLSNIEGIRGSNQADVLTGGNAANGTGATDGFEFFVGQGGNDTIDGGAGYDRADYTTSTTGAVVTLGGTGNGTASDGLGGTDTLISIEAVRGSDFNDVLNGSDTGTFESFEGRSGNDTIDGKGGTDRVEYTGVMHGVNVNLATGTTSDDGFGTTDTLLNVENVRASSWNDVITGDAGNNNIEGIAGNDMIDGGDGNDTLLGGTGSDSVSGGNGDDFIIARYASTLVSNTLGAEGNDTVTGGAGADRVGLMGAQSAYTVVAIAGGARFTQIAGGTTIDVTNDVEQVVFDVDGVFTTAGDQTTVTLASLLGPTAGPDSITGTSGNDSISGLGGNDTLIGLGGNDTLDGGTGADSLAGGLGNDTYVVDNAGDVTTELSGEGIDLVNSTISWTLAAETENLTLTGLATINGTGNVLANVITGNSAANVLDGGAGNDTMVGGLGNDTYLVDSAGDVITEFASGGVDSVQSAITYTLASTLENLTLTGVAAINGTGNGFVNVLTGNSAANILNGGLGADTLIGGLGNDTYVVDEAGDVITEFSTGGVDTVQSAITYTLSAALENLTLSGVATTNGTGNGAANILIGNSANNVLNGGAGADSMSGGAGNDTYVVDNAGDTITEFSTGGVDTVLSSVSYILASGLENLTLTGAGAINGTGSGQANTLTGNGAANILDGGFGADTMIGGAGNDTYVIDQVGDVITEFSTGGVDTVQSAITYTLGAGLENLTLTGVGNASGTGNSGANILIGNSAINTLNGGGGADSMSGGAGNDTYIVDNAGDVTTENPGEGTDLVKSTLSWTLADNVENLTLAGAAAINGTGNSAGNILTGNSAANTLDGGLGADTMAGGAGNDTYVVDNAGDVITEFSTGGVDTVQSAISYTLGAGLENLSLVGEMLGVLSGTGNAADNLIRGIGGDFLLNGGAGNDTLVGDLGWDTLTGGTGADQFNFQDPPGFSGSGDLITDFLTGTDKIGLSSFWFSEINAGTLTTADFFALGSAAADANDRIIYDQTTGALLYDADGNGAGAAARFATLGEVTHPALAYTDFLLV